MHTVRSTISILMGCDPTKRVAKNVLLYSICQHISIPLGIRPRVTPRLEALGSCAHPRDSKQTMAFSFTRFLVPHPKAHQGWALFMDCDMLGRADIKQMWNQRDEAQADSGNDQ